jgi:hypothetical protein
VQRQSSRNDLQRPMDKPLHPTNISACAPGRNGVKNSRCTEMTVAPGRSLVGLMISGWMISSVRVYNEVVVTRFLPPWAFCAAR